MLPAVGLDGRVMCNAVTKEELEVRAAGSFIFEDGRVMNEGGSRRVDTRRRMAVR